MCVILAQKAGSKKFPKDYYEASEEYNGDGNGLMWVEDGNVKIYKSMKSVWDKYEEVYEKFGKDSPIVIHCRIGTSGGLRKATCHPFKINDTVSFCHNGVLDIQPTKTKSDTMVFNDKILKPILNQDSDLINKVEFHEILEGVIGSNNKLVFLTKDADMHIINDIAGVFEEKGDWWFSNRTYKKHEPRLFRIPGKKVVKKGVNPKTDNSPVCFCCNKKVVLGKFSKVITVNGEFTICQDCYADMPMAVEANKYGMEFLDFMEQTFSTNTQWGGEDEWYSGGY